MADRQKFSQINSEQFSRILRRNVALPLIMSAVLSVLFISLILNLLSLSQMVDHTDLVIAKANNLQKLMVDAETGIRGYLVTHRDIYLEPFEKALPVADQQFRDLEEMVSSNPIQVDRLQKVRGLFATWVQASKMAFQGGHNSGYWSGEGSDLGKKRMDEIRAEVLDFLTVQENLRDERTATVQNKSRLILLGTTFLSLIVGALIAFSGRKQLINLSKTYEDSLQVQKEQNLVLGEQTWLRTGQAHLSDQIRGELSIKDLSSRILDYLANYVGANLGVLYVIKESGSLVQAASFACSDVPRSFRLGEGLVGQAALSHGMLTIQDLPADYIRITSGLGNCKPKHLLLVPLSAEGAVQAVLELGFLEPVSPSRMEFLEKSSEMLGVGIKSVLYRIRLQELLNQTQTQSEELQTQQEELRVSNEELSERSTLLQEAQARMEGQHAELEQTNEELEEQKQALDVQNQNLKKAQQAVELKAHELESANRYKSEFLANMSHELRTPLNSSLILAKLLKDNPQGNLTDEQIEFAATIYSAGNDLLVLINDILDLSKVEAGKLDLLPEKFSLSRLMESLEKTFKPIAREKKLALQFTIEKSAPETIETDRLRLEQILKNILSNALKFTDSGSVTLTASSISQQEVSFAIQDTGEGIAPEHKNVIFEAFRQADGTIKRKHGGTGLGLSISRKLAALLGGEINLESSLGKGSTFTLMIPTHLEVKPLESMKAHQSQLENPVPSSLSRVETRASRDFADDRAKISGHASKILLIVEDDPTFSKILFDLAREKGFKCLLAETTEEGYALVLKYLPSALILDMKLPDGLGLSLLERIKANSKTRHIPVHVISASDHSYEALNLGAVGYIFKPVDHKQLKEIFQKLEEKINQQVKRVLVVEDDAVQRKAIEHLIGEKGVEIVAVGLGANALQKLKSVHFDCMIIDLSLPDMSGFELLERMAGEENSIFPPVIVYTGRSLSRAEEEKLRKYSKTIIIKGARSPERLLDELSLFLHQVESNMSPERQKLIRNSRIREKAFEGRKVLLVDDDVRNIFALTSALEKKGAKIWIARNGREALERLEQEPDLDLVLMDIMMPEMDGYTAIREIRKKPQFKKLPIIAVTAKAMKDDYEKCLSAGASDYLAKPIDVDQLVSLMRVWLPAQLG